MVEKEEQEEVRLTITGGLNGLLKNGALTEMDAMLGITNYRSQINKGIESGEKGMELMESLYNLSDSIVRDMPLYDKSKLTCRKGCSFCCNYNVLMTNIEADAIIEYCKEKNIVINTAVLKNQVGLDDNERVKSKASACAFLTSDGSCGIYDVRPMACRKYFVRSDPKFCDASQYKQGVAVYADVDLEVITSSLLNSNAEKGIMAEVILKKLK